MQRSGRQGARWRVRQGLRIAASCLCLLAPLQLSGLARHAQESEDRVAIFSTMVVTEDHPASDVVCAFCTVLVDGDVSGDVAVIFSTVRVADGRSISGDMAALFSTVTVGEGSRINGDLATALSTTSVAESAHVGGDRTIVSTGVGLFVVLAPLLILSGLLWLVVWGVRRALGY